MGLNIKNVETEQLIRDLAVQTGESLTDAVAVAVRERLARVAHGSRRASVDELEEIAQDCARRLAASGTPPVDHAAMLYDERGLPR